MPTADQTSPPIFTWPPSDSTVDTTVAFDPISASMPGRIADGWSSFRRNLGREPGTPRRVDVDDPGQTSAGLGRRQLGNQTERNRQALELIVRP